MAEDPRAVAKAAGLNEEDALEPLAVAEAFVAATQEFAHPATLVQPVAAVFETRFGPRTLAASQSLMELNAKVLELWRAQAESTLSLWQGMVGVTSLSEAVQLQTSHLRRHYEETSRRARDIAQTAARMASGLALEAKAEIPPRER
ncbi:phasin family protein [Chelatococcus reniformis]|uniref:phasin family protein n=1 Tax=Chelatococcus reniformis TaxID=1494448 RepID=UPI00166D6888|nr:phasin family protein [Chelatococcus reniformis]